MDQDSTNSKSEYWQIDYDRVRMTIDLIDKGVRSAGCVNIRKGSRDQISAILTKLGYAYSIQDNGDHHCELLICKYQYLLQVAEMIESTQEPLRTWALGKLYGYSDNEIETYVAQQQGETLR